MSFSYSPSHCCGLHCTIPSITGIYLIFWHLTATLSHFKSFWKIKIHLFNITKRVIIEQAVSVKQNESQVSLSLLLVHHCYDRHLLYIAWTRVKGNDNMIGCTAIISVSTLYSRCYILTSISYIMTHQRHVLWTLFSWAFNIYRVDTILYLYTLPIASTLIFFSSLCLSYNLSQA